MGWACASDVGFKIPPLVKVFFADFCVKFSFTLQDAKYVVGFFLSISKNKEE